MTVDIEKVGPCFQKYLHFLDRNNIVKKLGEYLKIGAIAGDPNEMHYFPIKVRKGLNS